MSEEINITYETLFDLLRTEKTREELQKLDPDFFKDVVNYVKEKTKAYEDLKDKTDLFAADERLKAEKQLQNIKKIIKEIYERREKKIVTLAMDSSRMFSSVIDKSALLEEETQFLDQILNILNKFRKDVLFNMLEAQQPEVKAVTPEEPKQEEAKPAEQEIAVQEPKSEEQKEELQPSVEPTTEVDKAAEQETAMIRMLHPVPKFVGKNLEEYGPFDKDDVTNIPVELADLLVEKGRAELIDE